MSRATLAISCAAVLAALPWSARTAEPPDFRRHVELARSAAEQRQWEKADQELRRSMEIAEAAKSPALLATAAFETALFLRDWSSTDPAIARRYTDRLKEMYELVSRSEGATVAQKELAIHNLAVSAYADAKFEKAVALFTRLGRPTTLDAHVCYFNFGRALQSAHRPEQALSQYLEAVQKEPRFARAAEAVVELLPELAAAGRGDATRRLLGTYRNANPDAVGAYGQVVYRLLKIRPSLRGTEPLVTHLVHYLARASAGRDRFDREEAPRLNRAAAADPDLKGLTRELIAIYDGPLTRGSLKLPVFDHQVFEALPSCRAVATTGGAADLAAILADAAGSFAAGRLESPPPRGSSPRIRGRVAIRPPTAGELAEAAFRYTAAFAVDRQSPRYAIAALNLFLEHGDELKDQRPALDAYVKLLLDEKIGLKRRAESPREFMALAAMHTVLGTAYSQQSRWGSETQKDSAIFQWKEVLDDERRIREQPAYRTYPKSAVARHGLADAYVQVGKPNAAWPLYREALELLVESGQAAAAKAVVAKLDHTPSLLDLERRQVVDRYGELADALNQVRLTGLAHEESPVESVNLTLSPDRTKEVLFSATRVRLTRREFNPSAYSWDVTASTTQIQSRWLLPFADGSALFTVDKNRILITDPAFNGGSVIGRQESQVRSVDTSKTGRTAVSVGVDDDQIQVWNPADKKLARTIKSRAAYVALSPDGQYMVGSEGKDGVVRWDVKSGVRLQTLQLPEGEASALAFSPDGKAFAIALSKGAIQIRDSQTGTKRATLVGHQSPADPVVFSPDGRRLASVCQGDFTVRVWDLGRQKDQEVLRLGTGAVPTTAAFSGNGKTLAIGIRDGQAGEIRVWDLSQLR